MEDVDDDLDAEPRSGGGAAGGARPALQPPRGAARDASRRSLELETCQRVRQRLFGARHVPSEWRQGLYFSEHARMRFGLVQRIGGPCGLLACVQAELLCEAMDDGVYGSRLLALDDGARQQLLRRSLASILARCRTPGTPCVLVVAIGAGFGALEAVEVGRSSDVAAALEQHWGAFTAPEGDGVLCFLASVLLTKGLERIVEGMDQDAPFVGSHNTASLELVNLLLFGCAYSNLFDGNKVLSDDTGASADAMVLHGVPRQGRYGLLTLYEHFKSLEVGSFLKHPIRAVWIVHSEGHFTVAFCASDDGQIRGTAPFDLVYYDQLANHDDVVRLTLDARSGLEYAAGQLVSPINHVLRTRWPGASVDWNGAEPLL